MRQLSAGTIRDMAKDGFIRRLGTTNAAGSRGRRSLGIMLAVAVCTAVLIPLACSAAPERTAAAALASSYDASVLADAPVGYWTGAADVTGHGHDGAFTGTPGVAVMPNGDPAPVYDGVGQYLTVPDAADLSVPRTGVLTIEAWLRPDTLQFPHGEGNGRGYVHWLGKGAPDQHEYVARMYSLVNDDDRPSRISGYAFNAAGVLGAGSYFQDPVQAGEWISYALVINTVTRDAAHPTGYTKVFKNGRLRDQDSLSDYSIVPEEGTAPFRVGTRDLESFFQGAIGKVAVYDRELSPAQLLRHHTTMLPPPGSGRLVGTVGDAASSVVGTRLTVPVPARGVAAGNTLIARVATAHTAAPPTLTATRGNTCRADRSGTNPPATLRVTVFSCSVTTTLTAGDPLSLETTSVSPRSMVVDEFAGVLTPAAVDVSNTKSGTSATPALAAPLSTTYRDDLIVAAVGVRVAASHRYTTDPAARWRPLPAARTNSAAGGASGVLVAGAFQSVSVIDAVNYRPTLTSAADWIELVIAYKGRG